MTGRAFDERLALDLIEQGEGLMPLDRAVLLFSALADFDPDTAADLPIDQRDRRLIDEYINARGPAVQFFARCTHCDEPYEAEFDLRALPAAAAGEIEAEIGGNAAKLSAPSSRAIAVAALAADPSLLLNECVRPALENPSRPLVAEAEAALAEAFPLINVTFELTCEECGRAFGAKFDIGTLLWRHLDDIAQRALDTVDRLARAYGWNETEILTLSPSRRSAYLARLAAS